MRARRTPSTRLDWVLLALLLLGFAAPGCLGPGLEPPGGDSADRGGETPAMGAQDGGAPRGGSGGSRAPTGSGGTGPGASGAGGGGAMMPPAGGAAGDPADGGMIDPDEDAGATH